MRRALLPAALAALALSSAGCRDVLTATLQLASDDLAIVSTLDDSGALHATLLDEAGLGPLPLRDGDRAYAWVLSYGAFAALDGTLVPRPLAREVTLHVDDAPRAAGHGDCGRCVFPSDVAPQRVSPGDSCPIPAFARVVDLVASEGEPAPVSPAPADVEPLRARIVLDWPGACP